MPGDQLVEPQRDRGWLSGARRCDFLTMLPTTLLPSFMRIPDDKGTSCIILPVMNCPGFDLADEIVEFRRTGRIVPGGIAYRLLSGVSERTDCAGRVSGCAHDSDANINNA